MRTGVRRAACAALTMAVAAGGCRKDPADPVAAAVAAGVRAQLGVAVARVRCDRARCEVVLVDGPTLAVQLTGTRPVQWASDELIRTPPLAAYVQDELAGLGITATVDCGPALVIATPTTRITCRFAVGAERGAAWLDLGPDGGVALELALDRAAIEARGDAVDPAGLDDLSRALDTDQAQGVGPADVDDDAPDAGAAGTVGIVPADAQGS